MSWKNKQQITFGFTAGGAITKNRFVKFHTTDGQVVAAGDGDPVLGVALNTAASGAHVDVCLFGVVDVEAGAAITQNSCVGAGSSGKAASITIAATTADNDLAGMALEGTTNGDGDLISIFMGRNPYVATA